MRVGTHPRIQPILTDEAVDSARLPLDSTVLVRLPWLGHGRSHNQRHAEILAVCCQTGIRVSPY